MDHAGSGLRVIKFWKKQRVMKTCRKRKEKQCDARDCMIPLDGMTMQEQEKRGPDDKAKDIVKDEGTYNHLSMCCILIVPCGHRLPIVYNSQLRHIGKGIVYCKYYWL